MLLGVVLAGSEVSCRSGEPLTRCIQDLGRATRDFLLPVLSSLGLSSFVGRLPVLPSFSSFALFFLSGEDSGGVFVDTTRCRTFSVEN